MVGVNFWNFPTVHLRIFSDKAHVETVSSGTRWKIFGCNLKKAQRLLLLTLSKTVLVLLWFVTTTKTRQRNCTWRFYNFFVKSNLQLLQFYVNRTLTKNSKIYRCTAQRNILISRKKQQILKIYVSISMAAYKSSNSRKNFQMTTLTQILELWNLST